MTATSSLDARWLGQLVVGLLVAAGALAAVSGSPVTLPILGEISGVLAGLLSVLAGGLLTLQLWQPSEYGSA